MEFWNNKDERYRFKMVDVYNEQIKDLTKIIPNFKREIMIQDFKKRRKKLWIINYQKQKLMKEQVLNII